MTKEVWIRVCGSHNSPQTGEDKVEVITRGEYFYRNGKHYIIYEEMEEGQTTPVKNVIKFKEDYMESSRKGQGVTANMTFEPGKTNTTFYHTAYGDLLLEISAASVTVSVEEDLILAEAEYSMDMNYEHLSDSSMHIEIRPQKDSGFQLEESAPDSCLS